MPRAATIVLLILLGAACSRTEVAYRKADWLLEYYAWKTVHTSASQLDEWQPVLQATLRHHRDQELPLVVDYLDQARRFIREPDTSPGASCLIDGALLLYQRHARLAVDLAVPLLAGLEAGQIRHLAAYSSQRLQDAIEEYRSPDPQKRKQAREERITGRIENWTGGLDHYQRQLVSQALARIPDMSEAWLAYRATRTDKLIDMLGAGAGKEALRTYLEGWWVYRDGTSFETREHWQVARHESVQLMEKLARNLNDTQRTYLENRLAEVREDLAVFVPPAAEAVSLQLLPDQSCLTDQAANTLPD